MENASFLPWLAGTALVHSLAVAEARGAFKSWTVLLAGAVRGARAPSAWALASTAAAVVARRGGLRHAPAAFWGLVLAHAGLGVCIVGITMVKGHEVERDVRLSVGETVTVGAVQLRFRGIEETAGPNYAALRATLDVEQPGRAPFVLQPEKRLYKVQRMPMTEAAIDAGLTGDLYVALGEPLDERTWTMRVYLKPFIGWIWAGALLMALGGCCAVGDRRWRRAAAPAAAAWQREAGRT